MANKSISQLTAAATVSNDDLFETAIPDQESETGYTSKKHSMGAIASHVVTDALYPSLQTTSKSIVGAINEVLTSAGTGTKITGTLPVGTPTVMFMDAAIHTTSMIDIYVDTWGVAPTNVVVTEGAITLTFQPQQNALGVMILVR